MSSAGSRYGTKPETLKLLDQLLDQFLDIKEIHRAGMSAINDDDQRDDDGYWWYSPVSTVSFNRNIDAFIHSMTGSVGDQMGHHRGYLLDSPSLVCRRILSRSTKNEARLASACIS